ncbi:MAG TPA: NnrU family protein, partial [Candidatus Acidoferrum sp.]|nr:NnrU family protein [Candidatus Acidoferrum sp.]
MQRIDCTPTPPRTRKSPARWAFSFLASHLIISSSAVRARLIATVGEQPHRGIYSLVAFATLGPL